MDFTSALYLGFRHAHWELAPWRALTLGKPAALEASPAAGRLAAGLAELTGAADALLGPSTLHLFWDACTILAREPRVVFAADRGSYAVARWGLERAAAQGAEVRWFDHMDPLSLRRVLARRPGRPIVVTDGFCPACGRSAPLDEYAGIARRFGGRLLVDDTQALGLLGPAGGGSCRHHGIAGEDVIQIASLAKAFGAPLAVCAGSGEWTGRLRDGGMTQMHCSPPSEASIAAGLRALAINSRHGDALRARLDGLVTRFRRQARAGGVTLAGGAFPVQTVASSQAEAVHQRLTEQGLRTVLHRPRAGSSPCVSFIITAAHATWQIDAAAQMLLGAIAAGGRGERKRRHDVELAVHV